MSNSSPVFRIPLNPDKVFSGKEIQSDKTYDKETANVSPTQKYINELEKKVEKLETLLYLWQNDANDAKDRLGRLSMQKGQKNSAEIFYDTAIKRVIENLIAENNDLQAICARNSSDKVEAGKIVDYEKQIQALDNTIKNLRQELEVKFRNNQRLQRLISINERPEATQDLLSENKNNLAKISHLTQENTKLKTYLIQKHNLMEYLKYLFEKMNDDLVKLFVKHVNQDSDFLNQIKSSGWELPAFLLKPLVCNQETMTETVEHKQYKQATKPKLPLDDRCDSGITVSINEEDASLMEKMKIETSSHSEKNLIQPEKAVKLESLDKRYDSGLGTLSEKEVHLIEDLKLEKLNNQKLTKELEASHQKFAEKESELSEAEDELASWRTALSQSQSDVTELHRENSAFKDDLKTKEAIIMNLQKMIHQETASLMKDLSDAKEKIKSLEDINLNLHSQLYPQAKKSSPQRIKKTVTTTESQSGHATTKVYPTVSSSVYPEPRQRIILPGEPWQNQSWHVPQLQNLVTVAADGATKRDSISPPETEEEKEFEGRQPDVRSPIGQFRPAADIMGGLRRSFNEKLYQCDTCKKQYPSSLIWQHMRSCSNQLDEDD